MRSPGKSRQVQKSAAQKSTRSEITDFVNQVKDLAEHSPQGERGRLIFGLDATMSRQPTWDLACSLQAEMFGAVADTNALSVQLIYFRGFGECQASKWHENAATLAKVMAGIACQGGQTQIGKILTHARKEHTRRKVNAVVFVGDAMEEDVDALAKKAGELGLLGCPLFLFQEGRDPQVETAFREFARLSKGAYARFDNSAPGELASLLKAVAAFAAGGRAALKLQTTSSARGLLEQLR